MASYIECDKCGKRSHRKGEVVQYKSEHFAAPNVDLCTDCLTRLTAWLHDRAIPTFAPDMVKEA